MSHPEWTGSFSRPLTLESDRTLGDAVRDLVDELQAVDAGRIDGTDEYGFPQRFTADWSKRKWARLGESHRKWTDWTEMTVMLTFTCRTSWKSKGGPVPYISHYKYLSSSRNAVTTALSRALSDVKWQTVTVVGGDSAGYLHFHTGIWLSQSVGHERFDSVMNAHVDNCRLADTEAHDPDAGAVTTHEEDFHGLVAELGKNVPGMDARGQKSNGLISSCPRPHRLAAAALLAELDTQPIRWGSSYN